MSSTIRSLNFSGTSASELVNGTALADSIRGNAGNDTIFGGDGNDFVFGGDGNDSLFGDAGNDFIDAGNGNDFVSDGAGNDFIYLGKGNDVLVDGEGNDSVSLGAGADIYYAGAGSDSVRDDTDTTDPVDIADYSLLSTAVSFRLGSSTSATTVTAAGVTEVDQLTGFEQIIGTGHDDFVEFTGAGILTYKKPGTYIGATVSGGDGADSFLLKRVNNSGQSLAGTVKDFEIGVDRIGANVVDFNIGEFVPVLDENGDPIIEQVILDGVVIDEIPLEEFVFNELSFQNVARDGTGVNAGLVGVEAGHNVYALQGEFSSATAAKNALAAALSGDTVDDGAGLGVYFDAGVQQLRVFSTLDLDRTDSSANSRADVAVTLETGLGAAATIDLIATFVESDFFFVGA